MVVYFLGGLAGSPYNKVELVSLFSVFESRVFELLSCTIFKVAESCALNTLSSFLHDTTVNKVKPAAIRKIFFISKVFGCFVDDKCRAEKYKNKHQQPLLYKKKQVFHKKPLVFFKKYAVIL